MRVIENNGVDSAVIEIVGQAGAHVWAALRVRGEPPDVQVDWQPFSSQSGLLVGAPAAILAEQQAVSFGLVYTPASQILTAAGTISFGPYAIDIGIAERAATELCTSIYAASRAVDAAATAELRARVIEALSRAGIRHNPPGSGLTVSSGKDMTIWISLTTGTTEQERQELSDRILTALSAAGLSLESLMQTGASDPAERLAQGEDLYATAAQPEAPRTRT